MSTNIHSRIADYDPRSANPLYQFGWGIRFFWAGLRMLFRHPSLFGLSLLPIFLTAVLLVGLAWGSAWLVGGMLPDVFDDGLRSIASAVTFLLALLLGYFLYLPLARVLLAPFSEALSRKTHNLHTGDRGYDANQGWARAILEGVKLVALHMVVALAAFILGVLIPPIGAPVGVVVAVFLCGLDLLDVPLSARGLRLGHKLGVIWRNKSLATGFGAAVYLLLLIPVVNLLSLPVGVIGATLLADRLAQANELRE